MEPMTKLIKIFDVMNSNKKFLSEFLDHGNQYMIEHKVALRFRAIEHLLVPEATLYVEVPEEADDEIQKKFALNFIFMTMGATANHWGHGK